MVLKGSIFRNKKGTLINGVPTRNPPSKFDSLPKRKVTNTSQNNQPARSGLIHFTSKINGDIFVIHKNDKDPFPSSPHAHKKNAKNQKVDLRTGEIYQGTRNTGQKLPKKTLQRLNKEFEDSKKNK